MFTKQESLLDVLGMPGARLVIPVYQRVYAWSERQCTTLWHDVMRAGQTGGTHFLGTVLYGEEPHAGAGAGAADAEAAGAGGEGAAAGAAGAGGEGAAAGAEAGADLRTIDIIDGQQRLATITLLITALRDYLRETDSTLSDIDADTLTRRFLNIADDAGAAGASAAGAAGATGAADTADENAAAPGKLLLSRVDRATMAAVVNGTLLPADEDDISQNVVANYQLFRKLLAEACGQTIAESPASSTSSNPPTVAASAATNAAGDTPSTSLGASAARGVASWGTPMMSRPASPSMARSAATSSPPPGAQTEETVKSLAGTDPKTPTFAAEIAKTEQAQQTIEALWNGLKRLQTISASMSDGDRPQLVFESLNSKGMPLSTSDLIRNLLLINIGLDEQARLYEQYWAPIESLFADDLDSTQFTAALRGWLAVKAPRLCKRNTEDVYSVFKTYLETEHTGSLDELLFGLKGFCSTFTQRSQSAGARIADAHNSYGVAKVEGIISEKRLFGS